jgi:hypothetical protein
MRAKRLAALLGLILAPSATALADDAFAWVDTGRRADWDKRDAASTKGSKPRIRLGNGALCDEGHVNFVVTCWTNRVGGYPTNVPTDIVGQPPDWCAYKNNSVNINTPENGPYKGQLYVCSRIVIDENGIR